MSSIALARSRAAACSCGKICRAPCFEPRAFREFPFRLRHRRHPRPIPVVPASRQSARRHRRPADDRTRVPAHRGGAIDRVGDRRHRRRAHSSRRCGRLAAMSRMTSRGASERHRSHRGDRRRRSTCDLDRQCAGRRAAHRAGDDRRGRRAVCSTTRRLMMSTLRRRIDDDADRTNPNVTKVVVDRDGFALYFSRAPFRSRADGLPAGAGVAARRPVRLSARMPAASLPRCRRPPWNGRRRWNNCGRSSTASGSRRSKPTSIRSASIRRGSGAGPAHSRRRRR